MDGWISLTNLELYTALVDLLICSFNNRMIKLHHVVGYWNGRLTKLLSLRTLLHHHVEIFHFYPFACNNYYFWIWINLFSIFNVSNMIQSIRTVIAKLHRSFWMSSMKKKSETGGHVVQHVCTLQGEKKTKTKIPAISSKHCANVIKSLSGVSCTIVFWWP